jgi:hypothetical protein
MSVDAIIPFITKGYGLKSEDLDEVIPRENLRDNSQRFSTEIQEVLKKFSSSDRIRMIEFNEFSGSSRETNKFLNTMIADGRNMFYLPLYSNRNCCVILVYSAFHPDNRLLSCRLLPHEYAHHFQFSKESFPCILPKGIPSELYPEFTVNYSIGPATGRISIDNDLVDVSPQVLFKDLTERISDFICEKILLEKGYTEMLIDEYRIDCSHNLLQRFAHISLPETLKKYIRRLALFDEANWQSILNQLFPDNILLKNELKRCENRILRINKDYKKRRRAFNELHELFYYANYRGFKKLDAVVDCTRKILIYLGIKVISDEKWQTLANTSLQKNGAR